ncbi:hypothetical protein L9F63_014324, partial [Diploptera punctata]
RLLIPFLKTRALFIPNKLLTNPFEISPKCLFFVCQSMKFFSFYLFVRSLYSEIIYTILTCMTVYLLLYLSQKLFVVVDPWTSYHFCLLENDDSLAETSCFKKILMWFEGNTKLYLN